MSTSKPKFISALALGGAALLALTGCGNSAAPAAEAPATQAPAAEETQAAES